MEVKRAYMGAVFMYRDRKELFPVIENTQTLEYEVTSLVRRISAKANPILGIASTGAETQQASMQRLYEGLGRNYNVQPINLDAPIDKGVAGVLVLAPRQPFTEMAALQHRPVHHERGKVGIFANSYYIHGTAAEHGIPYNLNMNGLLNTYGIGLGEDMVMDVKCNAIQVPQQQGFIKFMQQFQIPFMPIISTFNKGHIISRDIQQVMTFFPSSVDTTLAEKKGFKAEGLMYTSDFSGRQTGQMVSIMPLEAMKKTDFLQKRIPIAAIVSGKFTSHYAQSGAPANPQALLYRNAR